MGILGNPKTHSQQFIDQQDYLEQLVPKKLLERDWEAIHDGARIADLHSHPTMQAWLFPGMFRRRSRTQVERKAYVPSKISKIRGMYARSLRSAFPLLDCGGFDVLLSTAHVPEQQIFRELRLGEIVLLASRILTGVAGYISKTYYELTVEQIERLADEVTAYNEWVEKQEWKVRRPREIEVVRSVTRLKEILKISDKGKRPIALVNAVEGAHSLQGHEAGRLVKAPTKAAIQPPGQGPSGGDGGPAEAGDDSRDKIEQEILNNVEKLCNEHSVASITVAHFYPNYVASPCFRFPEDILDRMFKYGQEALESSDPTRGLTAIGEKVIARMFELGMLVDVTHCTPACRRRIYAIAESEGASHRVFASHVGAYAINPNPYNLEDWEIKWIADHGGVVGIIFMNYWLMPHPAKLGLDFISRTIEHIRNVGGPGVVAIGSDFDGFTDPPDDILDAAQLHRLTRRLASERVEMDWKYDDQGLEGILGGNALNMIVNGWGKT